MQYIIPDSVYQVLKWACALVLPALATFVKALGTAWGWDAGTCDAIATTCTALAAFGGVVLGVSATTAKTPEGDGKPEV